LFCGCKAFALEIPRLHNKKPWDSRCHCERVSLFLLPLRDSIRRAFDEELLLSISPFPQEGIIQSSFSGLELENYESWSRPFSERRCADVGAASCMHIYIVEYMSCMGHATACTSIHMWALVLPTVLGPTEERIPIPSPPCQQPTIGK